MIARRSPYSRLVLPASNNYPNMPGGFTAISSTNSHRPFHSVTESSWNNFDTANGSIITDATAPINPTSVMQIKWPAGFVGGNAVFFQESGFFTTVSSIYVPWCFKISVGFKGHGTSGVNKHWFLSDSSTGGNAALYFSAQGGGTNNFQPQIRTQSGAGFLDLGPNVSGQTGFTLSTGVWYQCESILTMNLTSGSSDGTLDMYIRSASGGVFGPSVHTHSYTNVAYQVWSGGRPGWNLCKFQPIYGGGSSDSVPSDQFTYCDDIKFAGI